MAMRLTPHPNFWLSPLRALDALWPSIESGHEPHTEKAQVWMGRFSQAGWLGGQRSPRHLRVVGQASRAHIATAEHSSRLIVRSHANGLRISGRMQDVCAELDRLALLETAQDARALRH